jgi:hypothetical protein
LKIEFDSAATYTHPLTKADVQRLLPLIGDHITARIAHIRFGCNQKTTQEGRTVQRGPRFDIRINFCVKSDVGLLLSQASSYLNIIKACGGKVNIENNSTSWTSASAKRYAAFLLLHEIGHIAYCETFAQGDMLGSRPGSNEEHWCDDYAQRLLPQVKLLFVEERRNS